MDSAIDLACETNMKLLPASIFPMSYIRMIFIVFLFLLRIPHAIRASVGKQIPPTYQIVIQERKTCLKLATIFFPTFFIMGVKKIATRTEPIRKIPRDWNYFTLFLYMYLLFCVLRKRPPSQIGTLQPMDGILSIEQRVGFWYFFYCFEGVR